MALAFFLGMCTFLAVSKSVKTAIGLGVAVIFVVTITVPINNILYQFIYGSGYYCSYSARCPTWWITSISRVICAGR